MHPYLQPRADEISERLGPVLRELGLRTRLTYLDGYPRFTFEAPKKTGASKPFSPVAIHFKPKSVTKLPEAPWISAFIALADWEMKPVGNTGWSHRRLWQTDGYTIRSYAGWVLDEVEGHIRERGLIHLEPPGRDGIVDSEELADAVADIGNNIRDLAIVRIEDEKSKAVEAITFQDSEWRRIHMTFPKYHNGLVLVDGEHAGSFDPASTRRVGRLAYRLARAKEPDVDVWNPLRP